MALANHLVMGPAILAGALDDVPYAVKVHGSALEYTVKPHPRFLPFARQGLARAEAVLVGSRHTADSLWAAMDDPELPQRTRLGPPGVDVQAFAPREPEPAARELRALAERLAATAPTTGSDSASAFARDGARAGRALASLSPEQDQLVAFVGKLILSKGIDLLLAAWPLVLKRCPTARLVVIGFGAFQEEAQRLVGLLAEGDLGSVRELARSGRRAEGGPPGSLRLLSSFLDWLERNEERRSRYLDAARALPARTVFTGRLEHAELAGVLPACQALVVPSTFPEAFGMVAAEAAACGALPVSAAHSGLAEVSAVLGAALPGEARRLLSFELGPDSVVDLAERLCAWLDAPEHLRDQTRRALVVTAGERYSWAGVARGVIAAAQGRLDLLAEPGEPPSPAGRAGGAPGIEWRAGCGRLSPAHLRRVVAGAGVLATLAALTGCEVKQGQADLVNGKQLFVSKLRLLPRARSRRNPGQRGPQPRRGLPGSAGRRLRARNRARRGPRADPLPLGRQRDAGQAGHRAGRRPMSPPT